MHAASPLFDALKSPASLSSGSLGYISPRASLDSDDSALRDLEFSDNVLLVDAPTSARAKTFPLTPLDFEHDLLPLTAGLNNDGFATAAATAPEPQPKNLSLLSGRLACGAFTWSTIDGMPQVSHSSLACKSARAYCKCLSCLVCQRKCAYTQPLCCLPPYLSQPRCSFSSSFAGQSRSTVRQRRLDRLLYVYSARHGYRIS